MLAVSIAFTQHRGSVNNYQYLHEISRIQIFLQSSSFILILNFFHFFGVYSYRSSVLSDWFRKLNSLQSPKQSDAKVKQIVCWLPLVLLPHNKSAPFFSCLF